MNFITVHSVRVSICRLTYPLDSIFFAYFCKYIYEMGVGREVGVLTVSQGILEEF